MSSFSRLTVLAAVAALAGCAGHASTDPTNRPSYLGTPGDSPARTPFIAAGSLSAGTLVIDGAAGSYSVTAQVPDGTQALIPLVVTVIQGDVQRVVRSRPIRCNSSGSPVAGTCTDRASFVVSNSAGDAGTIVPGTAVVRLELKDGTTVTSQLDIPVTLVAAHAP